MPETCLRVSHRVKRGCRRTNEMVKCGRTDGDVRVGAITRHSTGFIQTRLLQLQIIPQMYPQAITQLLDSTENATNCSPISTGLQQCMVQGSIQPIASRYMQNRMMSYSQIHEWKSIQHSFHDRAQSDLPRKKERRA